MATHKASSKKGARAQRSNGSGPNARNTDRGTRRSATSAPTGLQKLFEHQLADLYYVEQQLVKQLPRMAETAQNEDLAEAFNDHLAETREQVKRLEQVFEIIGRPAKGQQCEAIDGILKEAKEMMEEFADDPALDAALVCAAQKVEHYEITSYGSLCAFAEQLRMDEVCDHLETSLDEEKDADRSLSRLAEQVLNIEADEEETEEEDTEEEMEETGAAAARG
jgi:ferritin-like metal-binding protein YciE